MKTVGAYEAKTHLPRLLDEVAAGETVTITRHGRPVARLVSVEGSRDDVADLVASMLRDRAGRTWSRESVRKAIDEGRN